MASLLDSLAARFEVREEDPYPTPGRLAKKLDPATVQTPALDLIDAALVKVDKGEINRLIVSISPQEGKSERITHYGTLWMLLRNPERRIGLVSYGEDVASRMSYAVRNDIATFNGDEDTVDLRLRLRRDSKAMSRWYLDGHRGGVYAVGIGGQLTGRPIDALTIDDPVKDYRAADSTVQSEAAWQWWMSVARPRLAPGAPVVIVLTRWSENDLAGRLLAKQKEDKESGLAHYDQWTVINIPAQADHRPEQGETDPLDREPGEFMISARGRTREQWEATKAATSARIWAALYQGRPAPAEGELLKRPFWQRFDLPRAIRQADGTMLAMGADEVIQSWDMAFKDKKSSDFVVGQVWGRWGTDCYLLDQVHDRLSFTDTVAAVRRMSTEWPQARAKLVEDKANGTAVIDHLHNEITGLTPVQVKDGKWARAVAVSPFIESRHVFVPSDSLASWADGFIEEAAAFKGDGSTHDDQVDAMTQALDRLLGHPLGRVTVQSVPRGRVQLPSGVGGVLAGGRPGFRR